MVKINGKLAFSVSMQLMAPGLRKPAQIVKNDSCPQLDETLLQQFRPVRAMAFQHLLGVCAFFLEFCRLK